MLVMPTEVAPCLKDSFYDDKPTPILHFSKEVIRPYYVGWIIKKKSIWNNPINAHILKFQQVTGKYDI